jgi:hypothetical protein
MFYKSRLDIIKNMFFIIFTMFFIMFWGILYYIIWQNWITNIVMNNFMWYLYPILISILIISFIYFFNKPVSEENKKYIEEAKTWNILINKKHIKETKSVKTVKWIAWFLLLMIELLLEILFIPFNI